MTSKRRILKTKEATGTTGHTDQPNPNPDQADLTLTLTLTWRHM